MSEIVDLYTGRFTVGDRVIVLEEDGKFWPYKVHSVHPAGMHLIGVGDDGDLTEVRVESLGWLSDGVTEVFGLANVWLVDSGE